MTPELLAGVLELLGEPYDPIELGLGDVVPVLELLQRSVPSA